jgi:hypothetical protein
VNAAEQPSDETLVRPYVLRSVRPAPFATPPHLAPKWEPLAQYPRVVLIAWGVDQAHVMRAVNRARDHASERALAIVDTVASYGRSLREAPFADKAARLAFAREVDYGYAWWLISDGVIPPDEIAAVQARQREEWSREPELRSCGSGALAEPAPYVGRMVR